MLKLWTRSEAEEAVDRDKLLTFTICWILFADIL